MQSEITVIQITDTHLGREPGPIRAGYPDSDAQLEAVLDDVLRHHPAPDLTLVTGDLAEDPETPVYERLVQHLSRLPAPITALAGNHDDRDRACEAFLAAGHGFDGERVLGNWLIIGLDSSWLGHVAGLVSADELRRVEDAIAWHPEHWVLVAVHHPVVPVGSRWLDRLGLTNGDELLSLLGRHPRARAVIFGHIHQTLDQMHGSIRLLGCPSTMVQFLPGAEDFALDPVESGYRVLRLHADGRLETEIRRVPATRPAALPA
jgi:3',5'-cyclic-AMP phosphodiesterase